MDTAQDISKVDQLSIVVRYAVITRSENGQPIDIEVKEVFLGFYAAIKHGSVDLVNQVTTLFIDKNIDLKKFMGQGYDGASVMSGVYNGVQKHIKDIQPNTEYVHCATHNLNLVIKDAVSSCVEIQIFFATLQDLYNFFGNRIKRWNLLSKFTGESDTTLKKTNPTRWSSRVNTISAIKLRYFYIIKALSEIVLKSPNKDERSVKVAVHQLCKEKMSKYGVLECDLTEVFTAMLLFFTIPVTSAAAKRSFSKLKIMERYLRNNMGRTRLRHLSLIAIENKTASSLDLNKVIDSFAKTKARKIF
ncbi:zinc finger MYM-type protein 1-like [Parasteatoda tepidariorum]|uniref:zinc finger MYM-type protein 1-like n=1 Tax=Parasteatoda tepidariorum TaxID=114398 RepID=UPI0039BCAD3D